MFFYLIKFFFSISRIAVICECTIALIYCLHFLKQRNNNMLWSFTRKQDCSGMASFGITKEVHLSSLAYRHGNICCTH